MPPAGAPLPHPPTTACVTVEEAVHGKARVRVAVTGTRPEAEGGGSTWTETAVSVILRGGAAAAFTEGDNRGVVSTDTVKNVVYVVAARHPTTPPESFGLALAATYLSEYSHVTGVDVRLQSPSWSRVQADGAAHPHGFVGDTGTRTATVTVTRGEAPVVTGGVSGLRVLKTTASGWSDFHAGRYSTLPPTDDRVLATELTAEWHFTQGWADAGDPLAVLPGGDDASAAAVAAAEADPAAAAAALTVGSGYADAASAATAALLAAFFGDPAEGGVYSAGMQQTLVAMGAALLAESDCAGVGSVRLSLPNLHFLPSGGGVVPLLRGDPAAARVYVPTDEPHGLISAVVRRT